MTLVDTVGVAALGGRWAASHPTHDDRLDTRRRILATLTRARLVVDAVDEVPGGLRVGDSVPDVTSWFLTLPESRPLRGLSDRDRRRFLSELATRLARHERRDGVHLSGTAWLVAARRT